jgi:hypothetical protein
VFNFRSGTARNGRAFGNLDTTRSWQKAGHDTKNPLDFQARHDTVTTRGPVGGDRPRVGGGRQGVSAADVAYI